MAGTVLAEGRVLLTGSDCDRYGPQIYDPRTDTVSSAAAMPVPNGGGYTATLLRSGKVLLAGGYGAPRDIGLQPYNVAQLYDPATNSWTLAAQVGLAIPILSAAAVLAALMFFLAARRRGRR